MIPQQTRQKETDKMHDTSLGYSLSNRISKSSDLSLTRNV